MFETPEERIELLINLQKEVAELLQIQDLHKIFHRASTFRLKKDGYKKLKKIKPFIEIKIETPAFKVQDLVKISKLNSNLFYIDMKKSVIYTLDEDFANWCRLSTGHLNSIRLA